MINKYIVNFIGNESIVNDSMVNEPMDNELMKTEKCLFIINIHSSHCFVVFFPIAGDNCISLVCLRLHATDSL